jgi:hypothetical protein
MGMRTKHQREEKALSIVHAHSMEDMLRHTSYEGQSLRALNDIAKASNNQAEIVAAAARQAALASASLQQTNNDNNNGNGDSHNGENKNNTSSTLSTPETRAPGVPLTIGALADAGRYRVDPLPRNMPLNSDVLLPEPKLVTPAITLLICFLLTPSMMDSVY